MPVALAANALIDEAEFATFLGGGSALATDDARRVINRASSLAQEFLGRLIRKPADDLEEFHTLARPDSEIHLLDWPINSVTSVFEDETRVYGAEAELDAVDFIVSKPGGKLIRVVDGGGATSWLCGLRAVKVVYKSGWDLADVPGRFKDFAGAIACLLWQERKSANFGLLGGSDAVGQPFTRSSASHLPSSITDAIEQERAPIGDRTGERDV